MSLRWRTHKLRFVFFAVFCPYINFLIFSNYYLAFIPKHPFTPVMIHSPVSPLLTPFTPSFFVDLATFFLATLRLYPISWIFLFMVLVQNLWLLPSLTIPVISSKVLRLVFFYLVRTFVFISVRRHSLPSPFLLIFYMSHFFKFFHDTTYCRSRYS